MNQKDQSYHIVQLALAWFLTERVCTAAAGSGEVNQDKQSKQVYVFPFLTVYFQCVDGK